MSPSTTKFRVPKRLKPSGRKRVHEEDLSDAGEPADKSDVPDDGESGGEDPPPRAVKKRKSAARSKRASGRARKGGNSTDEDAENDSDALDDDDFEQKSRKRRRSSRKVSRSIRKKQKKGDASDSEQADNGDSQEVVGEVVQAPVTGRVPPGQISQNTFEFLTQLQDPECNDREWFKLHEPVYRLAEKEWKDFVEVFTESLCEVDPQIPPLPPRDVVHRIYRDIRFSNDKTPYKTGFAASFSRSGRKGIFAGYHISVKPGNQSLIAAGTWCPGKNELATIRSNIQINSTRLRETISAAEFVQYFGEPRPHSKGRRQNIFGMDDELKVAPKGVDKNHQDIDLLKCRSFAVMHRFLDSEVLSADFTRRLAEVSQVMRPLVHCLNDMMTIHAGGDGDNDSDD